MNVTTKRQIKIHVDPQEHDRVRVAAAMQGMTMAVFCRRVALSEAERVTKGLPIPHRPASRGRRTAKNPNTE